MSTKKFRLGAVLTCTALVVICACLSQATTARAVYTGPGSVTDHWAWTTEPWNGNDQPFHKARWDIWRAISAGQKPADLARGYKASAKVEAYHPPYNALAQYRWAYAVYEAALADPKERNSSEFVQASQALGYGPSPHSYEYARLRFLMEAMNWPDPHLMEAGQRLVQRDPKDFQVKYHLVHVLASSGSTKDRAKALPYAEELVQAQPHLPVAYALVGEVYYTSWLVTRTQSDEQKAVAAYGKYLTLSPQNDEFRSQAQYLIRRMQQDKSR